MVKKLVFVLLFLLSIVGCGYYEGVVQPSPKSYVVFTGNSGGAAAIIDDSITIDLEAEIQKTGDRGKTILFQVAPGKHKIIVKRAGTEIVNRVVIIAEGATREIQIP